MKAFSDSKTLGVIIIPDKSELKPGDKILDLPVRAPDTLGPDPVLGAARARLENSHLLVDLDNVRTNFLLLMVKGETMDMESLKQALPVLAAAKKKPLLVTVRQRLSRSILEPYEWAGTRGVFLNPHENISTIFCQEIRLVPVLSFADKKMKIRLPDKAGESFFVLGLSSPIDLKLSSIILDAPAQASAPKKEKPTDFEIFVKGHENFYDDTVFCQRFVWPPSMYLLIRKTHIPGIIRGMEQGLCNTEILSYAFNYLVLTGDFESAQKLVELVPCHWFVKSPMLAQVCGAVLTMQGKMDKAIKYFELAQSLDDDPMAMFNLGKMYLITGRPDKADDVFQKSLSDPSLPEDQRPGIEFFINSMKTGVAGGARLSLCMIAKDEQDALPRALSSVYGLVDEIVVVDTGSCDSTKAKAKKFGAKVYDFAWDECFSAARNFALAKASGDYVFFLDADERLSPFHRINLLFLKMLMSRDSPNAYELSLGRTDVTTDWLIISALPDNFIQQTSSIRIFPRLEKIRYTGRVAESVAQSLEDLEIPITNIPPGQLDIIHDEFGRERRISRKTGAYDRSEFLSPPLVARAVKDYSSVRDEKRTIKWLKSLYALYPDNPENYRLLTRLALMMEDKDPAFSTKIYKDLLNKGENPPLVINAFSSFLVRNNDFDTLASLEFDTPARLGFGKTERSFSDAVEQKTFYAHQALACFADKDIGRAAEILESLLKNDQGFVLGQAARFFILSAMGMLDGALSAMEDIAFLVANGIEAGPDNGLDFMGKIEAVSAALEKTSRLEERFLILNGATLLVTARRNNEQNIFQQSENIAEARS